MIAPGPPFVIPTSLPWLSASSLWIFGRNFGASTVQGFAYTLAIGVVISMFTAVIVTRTFVRIFMGRSADWLQDKQVSAGGIGGTNV